MLPLKGLWKVMKQEFSDVFQATKPTAVRQIGHLLLGGGLVVIVVAFLGCCGAAKEWRPLLCCVGCHPIGHRTNIQYATCLMVILAIEIAAGIYAAMHSNMVRKLVLYLN